MLYGIDVSHWNYGEIAIREKLKKSPIGFVMIKTSEGETYRDPSASLIFKECLAAGAQIGFYHYCRPEINDRCELEVDNFLSAVNEITKGKDVSVALCIDWEGNSVGHEQWLAKFVKVLTDNSGVNPIVYCSESVVDKAGAVLDTEKVGLWVAAWSRFKGKPVLSSKTWKLWAFHQYGQEDGFDMNVFNGAFEQLRKYFQYRQKSDESTHCCCACHNCTCCTRN